jgi:hypothetical protein
MTSSTSSSRSAWAADAFALSLADAMKELEKSGR